MKFSKTLALAACALFALSAIKAGASGNFREAVWAAVCGLALAHILTRKEHR